MYRNTVIAWFVVMLLGTSAWGQDRPDLSGTWQLNVAKSEYGDMQGPSSRTDVIEQHANEIRESVLAEGRHKTQQYTLTFSTDGKKTEFPVGAEVHMGSVTLQSISATWQDKSLIVLEKVRFQDSDLVVKNKYTLSPDGKLLTIATSLNGEVLETFAFDRLPMKTKRSSATP